MRFKFLGENVADAPSRSINDTDLMLSEVM